MCLDEDSKEIVTTVMTRENQSKLEQEEKKHHIRDEKLRELVLRKADTGRNESR